MTIRRSIRHVRTGLSAASVVALAAAAAGCGIRDWLAKSMASGVSSAMTVKTDKPDEVLFQARYWSGLYPAKVNSFESHVLKDQWAEGGNLISVQTLSRNGGSMVELDGVVKIDGQAVPYLGYATYGKHVEGTDPKTVSIETKNGKAEVTVKPIASVKILEVNGGKPIDLATLTPFTIKLQNPPGAENTAIRVSLQMKGGPGQAAIGDLWTPLGVYRSADEISVPKYALSGVVKIDKESTLLVERFSTERPAHTPNGGSWTLVSTSLASAPVSVIPGDGADGVLQNKVFRNIPLSLLRKAAVGSFSVHASLSQVIKPVTKSDYVASKETTYSGTLYYPDVPQKTWDDLSARAAAGFQRGLSDAFGELLAADKAIATDDYAALKAQGSAPSFSREQYLTTRDGTAFFPWQGITGQAGAAGFSTIAEGPSFCRMIDALGVDAIAIGNLELAMDQPDPKDLDESAKTFKRFPLEATFAIRLIGPATDWQAVPTTWGTFSASSKKVVDLETMRAATTVEQLAQVFDVDRLVSQVASDLANKRKLDAEGGPAVDFWKMHPRFAAN